MVAEPAVGGRRFDGELRWPWSRAPAATGRRVSQRWSGPLQNGGFPSDHALRHHHL